MPHLGPDPSVVRPGGFTNHGPHSPSSAPCSLGKGVSAGPNRQHAPENNNFTKFLCHLPAIRSISSTIIYISRQLFSTSQRSVFASPATTTSALPNSPSTVLDLAYLRGNEAGHRRSRVHILGDATTTSFPIPFGFESLSPCRSCLRSSTPPCHCFYRA
jgi:hypothetical protein